MPESEWSYEQSVAAIEAIAACLEAGTLPLEEMFSQFEIAAAELRRCEAFLAAGRDRLDLVVETLTDPSDDLT
ncbi:MAG: exodeoxyribonuclease VII small subunit [Spirulinaceae cyanobacterium RM2_2_10]|nr:exodeoxyribonuclease VII small subunit [Spirulinaceae cyanobacterium SM2_1_0]NJO21417.1 exodeoxyribonuclease VII small subunit [Spirulinaceae cyanobacterium RM2_2_10]